MWHGYQVDYGYFSRDEAGSSHPISLSARIGPSLDDRERVRAERLEAEAIERVQRILGTRISDHIATADSLRADGQYELALDELKIAREYDPTNEEVSRKFDEVQQEIVARQAEASRESEKAIMINQHFQLGIKYYGDNDYVQAKSEWRNVLDLDPENEGASDYLARTEERIAEQVALHRQRARDFEARGELASALTEWNVVRTLDPENEEMTTSIERVKSRLEDMSRSYQTTSRRLEIVELFEQALGYFSEGQYDQARSKLRELLRKDPNHAEAQNLLLRVNRRLTPLTDEQKEEVKQLYIAGMKHFTQGNYTAAIDEWRKILRIDPDNESVQRNIEEAQRRLGRGDDREAE
jgi:Tfp pilus assembly protein PilF